MKIEGEIIEFTNKYLKQTDMSKTELADRMGVSRSLVSRYLKGTYDSDPKTIKNAIIKYFEGIEDFKFDEQALQNEFAEDDKQPVYEKTGKLDKFFESTDAINITGLCSVCQRYTESAIITGRSGYGKTYALRNYARKNKVCYLSCEESMTSKDLINALEKTVGLPKGEGSIYERMKGIKEFFKINEGYLLIIDEADKLASKYSMKKVEALRNLFDEENND